ncbi:hypothetical protein ABTM91_20910, partial [Acinetobacter baumannii]
AVIIRGSQVLALQDEVSECAVIAGSEAAKQSSLSRRQVQMDCSAALAMTHVIAEILRISQRVVPPQAGTRAP